MSDAYSICAKLQLDTSKFTGEINKITKNLNNLSKTMSSMLGGEFEKTIKSMTSSSKGLSTAVSKDFKDIANVACAQAKVINESFGGEFKKTTKSINNSTKSMAKTTSSSFKSITQSAKEQSRIIKKSFGSAFEDLNQKVTKISSSAGGNFLNLGGSLAKVAAIGGVTAGVFSVMHKGLERFSIIQDFPKQMAAFGISAQESKKGIDTLKDSIVGLPVSLADTVAQTQMLYATTRNFDKSTKLVIALNGAFAASKVGAVSAEAAFDNFNKALSAGKIDMQSLNMVAFALGPALDEVAESFGYAKGQTLQFKEDLVDGKITMTQFSDKLADMNGRLSTLGKEAGSGVSTSLANLNNAFASLGAAAWEALDEISKAFTGCSIQENVDKISGGVKALTGALKAMFPKTELKEGSDALKESLPKNEFLESIAPIVQFTAAFLGIAVVFTLVAKIVGGVIGLFSVFGTIFGVITAVAASAAGPFIALGIVIAAVVGIIIYHWDQISGFFINLWNGVCQIFENTKNDLCAIGNAIGAGLSAIWNGICSTAKWLWDTIVNTVVGIWNGLISSASKIFEDIKATIVGIWDGISSKASEIWGGIESTIKGIWNSIKDIFDKVTGFFGGGAKAASVSVSQESINVEDLTRTYSLNHNFKAFEDFTPGEINANVSVSAPSPNVYVLLDGSEIATKSFTALDNLINSKVIINKSKLSGAM